MNEKLLEKLLFGGDAKPQRDPNHPENQPYFSALAGIKKQAFAAWLSECGGEVILDEIETKIRGKMWVVFNMPLRNMDDIMKFIAARQTILDDAEWYGNIVSAFNKNKEEKDGGK